MKKTISLSLICLILVCSLLSLTSCGSLLYGKYRADFELLETTYEFEISGKVTKIVDPIIGDDVILEGEYKISENGTKITFVFEDDSETHDFVTGEEGGIKYIKIDNVKYEEID